MSTVFIVIPNDAVGGMEKRMAGLFVHLARRGDDVRMVAANELFEALEATPDGAELSAVRNKTIRFDWRGGGFSALSARLRQVFADAPDGVFHYGLVSPLFMHRSRSPRTLYTIPNASLAQYSRRGIANVYGGILRSTRVDVLDGEVFEMLVRRFPWRRGSFSRTPGSFVDLDVYKPKPAAARSSRIVFAGLFSDEKQAPRLAECLPELLQKLDAAGFAETEIWMLGRDTQGTGVADRVAAVGSPRVRARYEPNVRDVLASSKVFLSLQRSTNHPSKALLEAMACGCAPVVTDTRDSRRSAPDDLATYVPRDFTADDLARACIRQLRTSESDHDARIVKTRRYLAEHFSADAMANYYRALYDQLQELPI